MSCGSFFFQPVLCRGAVQPTGLTLGPQGLPPSSLPALAALLGKGGLRVDGASISQHHDAVITALRPWCCEMMPPSDKGVSLTVGLGRAPSESRSST